jgi:hypothetical protein
VSVEAWRGESEEVDGIALEARPDVGVDGSGDADMGMTQQLLDQDEFHSWSRRKVAVEWRRSCNRMRRSLAWRSRVFTCRARADHSIGALPRRVKT